MFNKMPSLEMLVNLDGKTNIESKKLVLNKIDVLFNTVTLSFLADYTKNPTDENKLRYMAAIQVQKVEKARMTKQFMRQIDLIKPAIGR